MKRFSLPSWRSLLSLSALLLLLPSAPSALSAEGGYLFVTTRGEGVPQGEQIYFGLSQDGFRWEAANGGNPVLISTLGQKGARDPFLLRAKNGKFYILATDLCIGANRDWKRAEQAGSRSLLIWESGDLVHWSEPGLLSVAAPDAGCAWAPEAIYNPANDQYLVYWSSKSKWDHFAKSRIWGAWTKDFQTCSDAFIYMEKPGSVGDLDIVQGGGGKYYRFVHDQGARSVAMEVSESLMGDWQPVSGAAMEPLKGGMGPTCYPLNSSENGGAPSLWCLLLDYGGKIGYKPFVASSLATGKFEPIAGFTFPFQFRQGSVLPLNPAEYERLKSAYLKGN